MLREKLKRIEKEWKKGKLDEDEVVILASDIVSIEVRDLGWA